MIPTPIFTISLPDGVSAEQVTPEIITPQLAAQYIQRHVSNELPRLQKLERYYNGEHDITNRGKEPGQANNRLVTNHAKYIADFTSGYLIGEPVSYTADADITAITDALKNAKAAVEDTDLALDCAKFGRAYEIIYMYGDPPKPRFARISPLNAFVVYDDTVNQTPVFGIYYMPIYDATGQLTGYNGCISTATYIQELRLSGSLGVNSTYEPIPHYFGMVTINEIYNDFERVGDFEDVISLMDAYNVLQSDRVNDKEQFVNALLVIKGQVLGDTDEESAERYDAIKAHGVMTLDRDGEAAYLTRQLDESNVEVLKTSIVHDIHKISCVPDMSDQNFAGNVSGVAMRYKLLGLEQKTKVKERFFEEGLRYRLECIANILATMGAGAIDTDGITIQFTRSLPANYLEEAQIINSLQGIVSNETLLSRLNFISDPAEELKKVEKDKEAALKRQDAITQAMMKRELNNSLDDV